MILKFATIGIAVGILVAFGCGRWLLHRPKPLRMGLLVGSIALVLLKGCFVLRPDWEFPLVQRFGLELGWFTGWWPLIPFSLLLGYSTHFLPQSRRSIYYGFAGFFYLIFLLDGGFRLITDYRDLNGKPDDQGVCLQSSEYSCGAAAAASFLFLLGYSTSEAEMARLCRPSRITGVNEYILAWAINQYLQQHQAAQRVQVDLLSNALPQNKTFPLLAIRRLNFLVAHWIVLARQEGNQVWVLDPLEGARRVPLATLQKTLQPVCIRLQRQKPILPKSETAFIVCFLPMGWGFNEKTS